MSHMQLKHESKSIDDYNLEEYRIKTEELGINENIRKLTCPICNHNILANRLSVNKHFKRKHPEEVIDPTFLSSLQQNKTSKQAIKPKSDGLEPKRIKCPVCSRLISAYRENARSHFSKQHRDIGPDKAFLATLPILPKKCKQTGEREQVKRFGVTSTKDSSVDKLMCTRCGEMKSRKHMGSCKGGPVKHPKKNQKVDKNLHCESCKRHFINEKQMKNHVCAHLQCELCDEKFIRIRNLKIHMKGHEGYKIIPCEVEECEGLFLSRRRYLAHKRDIHDPKNQERKFKCDNCDAAFKTRPTLTKHIKALHSGRGRDYKCSECDKAYTKKYDLLTHMHLKHKQINGDMFYKKCSDCHLEIWSLGEYKHHRERFCKALKKVKKETEVVEESASAVASIQFEMSVL